MLHVIGLEAKWKVELLFPEMEKNVTKSGLGF